MGRKEKLFLKARNNPKGLRFLELESVLESFGWLLDRQKGSHRIRVSKRGARLPLQDKGGKAKSYQVLQALTIIEREKGGKKIETK